MAEAEDRRYMTLALEEAQRALERGDGPIGCVIVDGARVIARAGNMVTTTGSKLDHAEMVAIRAGAAELSGRAEACVLYTTVEPCAMCLAAAATARIGTVVFGAADPARGGAEAHRHLSYVRDRVRTYRGGVLAGECTALWARWSRA